MKRTFTALAAALLLAAPALQAQDNLPRPMGAQEQFSFSHAISGSTGPYIGNMESMPGRPEITLYCVDYFHGISRSSGVITVDVTSIGPGQTNAGMGNTRLGYNADDALNTQYGSDLFRYRRAAFLAAIFTAPGISTSQWSGIHAAIWSTMSPGYANSSRLAAAAPWLQVVEDAINGTDNGYGTFETFDFSGWSVLTDVRATDGISSNGEGVQEYLVRTATPEPATLILLFSGMLLMGVVARRRLTEIGAI